MSLNWSSCYICVPSTRGLVTEDNWRNANLPSKNQDFSHVEPEHVKFLTKHCYGELTRDHLGDAHPEAGSERFMQQGKTASFTKSEVMHSINTFFNKRDTDMFLLYYSGAGRPSTGDWQMAMGETITLEELMNLWNKKKANLHGHEKFTLISDCDHSHKWTQRCYENKYEVVFQASASGNCPGIGAFSRIWNLVQQEDVTFQVGSHMLDAFDHKPGHYIPPGWDAPFYGPRRLRLLGKAICDPSEREQANEELKETLNGLAEEVEQISHDDFVGMWKEVNAEISSCSEADDLSKFVKKIELDGHWKLKDEAGNPLGPLRPRSKVAEQKWQREKKINPRTEEIITIVVSLLRKQALSSLGTQLCLRFLWGMARDRNTARKTIINSDGGNAVMKALALHPGDEDIVNAACGLMYRINQNKDVLKTMAQANPIPVLYAIGDLHEGNPEMQIVVCLALSSALHSSTDKNELVKNAIDVGTRCCKILKKYLNTSPAAIQAALCCLSQVFLHLPMTKGNLTVTESWQVGKNAFITSDVIPLLFDAIDPQDAGVRPRTDSEITKLEDQFFRFFFGCIIPILQKYTENPLVNRPLMTVILRVCSSGAVKNWLSMGHNQLTSVLSKILVWRCKKSMETHTPDKHALIWTFCRCVHQLGKHSTLVRFMYEAGATATAHRMLKKNEAADVAEQLPHHCRDALRGICGDITRKAAFGN